MQQLLDKWERLRKSEYLRPDEKLMLNHCISDLKRFMDHSGEVNEMVGNRTAVEWLIEQLTPVITLQQKHIDVIKSIAKEMEKEYYTEFEVLQLLLKLRQTESYDNLYDWFQENKKQTYGGNK
jgi:hypothetical protein